MESLYLQPVTCEENNNILASLKNTACGWDVFQKLLSQFSMQPLCYICNLSLTECVFPHHINIASVILLYKADDPMSFSHYRPVSLLCVLYKVFENFLYTA